MSRFPDPPLDDRWILSHRPAKNPVDLARPYAILVEDERDASGRVLPMATVFLTNRECPFRCLMCDLWKNTTDDPTPLGAIPAQIAWALDRLAPAEGIKLYNSGNFFDVRAIPPADHDAIAALLDPFRTVIVESHPRLLGPGVLSFRDRIRGRLEVALGLETVHPEVLRRLNKRMDLDDFRQGVDLLVRADIPVRAFILLRPPFMTETEGVEWACRSIDFAFDAGVECVVVIPTRAGNGALDKLAREGTFQPPSLSSLEVVQAYGIDLNRGRVFADLWDLSTFSDCPTCLSGRKERMDRMNREQRILPSVSCACRPK